jgi:hypothetical protein
MFVDEPDCPERVVDMDPAEPLSSVSRRVSSPDRRPGSRWSDPAIAPVREPAPFMLGSSRAESGRDGQHVQRRSVTEHDRHPQRDSSGRGQIFGEEFLLPGLGDVDREPFADVAVVLGLRSIHCVTVDGGRARVDPQTRRRRGGCHGRIESAGRIDSGVPDDLPVGVRVPTSDAATGEVDEQICTVDEFSDSVGTVPDGVGGGRGAADRSRRVPPGVERIEQLAADEPRRPGDDGDRRLSACQRCVCGFRAHTQDANTPRSWSDRCGTEPVWWVSRGESRFWICTGGVGWSRVISRCPAGNTVFETLFLPGLTRTNTVCSTGSGDWVGNRKMKLIPPVNMLRFCVVW